MSRSIRTGACAALMAGLAFAAPMAAQAQSGTDGGPRGAGRADAQSAVPSRVRTKLRRVSSAVDRASGYTDDSNATSAIAALTSARRNLAAAQKTGLTYVVAAGARGPAVAGALARTDDDVAGTTAGLFDGVTGDEVDALATTLDAALDSREALLAQIAALGDDDEQDYDDVLNRTADQLADEADDIAGALADDDLTAAAKTALTDALTRVKASATAVATELDAPGSSSDDDDAGYGSTTAAGGDCPKRDGGDGSGAGYGSDTGSTGGYGTVS